MRSIALSLLLAVMVSGCSTGEDKPSAKASVPIDHTYAAYAELLATNVHNSRVDYTTLKANRGTLDSLVNALATADIAAATIDQRLAFYINAYNLITLRSVIDAYPVKSIQDIKGVWDKKEWPVAGESITLNHIEHEILRKQFTEPRIHMAVNCASIGCPPLASTPYLPDSIKQQLTQASYRFCTDSAYNRIDTTARQARLSSIFDWYGDDFVARFQDISRQGQLNAKQNASVLFVLHYQPTAIQDASDDLPLEVTYLDYDWNLNDTGGEAAP